MKLIVLGAAFILLPLLLPASPFAKVFSSLIPVGLIMAAVGALIVWISRHNEAAETSLSESKVDAMQARSIVRRQVKPAAPIDRTPTELLRALDRAAGARPSPAMHERQAPQAWSSAVFDVIEWRRFEAFVEALFEQAGFETKSQSHGADEGVDIWLYSRNQPGEPVSLVQCKHWTGRRVGVDKIRELRGVMAARNVRRGQFATTSTFTLDAIAFARDNGINLLDARGLLALVEKRTPEQQRALLEVALEGDYARPTCVNCGVKMVERNSRKDGSSFWGCAHYPRCKTTMPMRAT